MWKYGKEVKAGAPLEIDLNVRAQNSRGRQDDGAASGGQMRGFRGFQRDVTEASPLKRTVCPDEDAEKHEAGISPEVEPARKTFQGSFVSTGSTERQR